MEKTTKSFIMSELESLGREQIKNIYMKHGAREPLFGVTTGAMKPLTKKIGISHELAMELYDTGNYDAMYLAGMISAPKSMSEMDIELWMQNAYFQGLSNFVVARVLAGMEGAQEIADRWMNCGKELYQSAGWTCYAALVEYLPDYNFDRKKISSMLKFIEKNIHTSMNWVKYAMNGFLISVGISYLPLHEESLRIALAIGEVKVNMEGTNCKTPLASSYIQNAVAKGRLGYKRKTPLC